MSSAPDTRRWLGAWAVVSGLTTGLLHADLHVSQIQRPPATIAIGLPAADCFDRSGCLDRSFGDSGRVPLDLSNEVQGPSFRLGPPKILAQADGHLIVAGLSTEIASGKTVWVVARFRETGEIDSTFGTNGIASLTFPEIPEKFKNPSLTSVAVQQDGKILVSGWGGSWTPRNGLVGATLGVITRLEASGQLDSTFGEGGRFVIDRGGGFDDVALQADGKILLLFAANQQGASVLRLDRNGDVDRSFGAEGFRFLTSGVADKYFFASRLEIQSPGRILAAARNGVQRVTTEGNLDVTFGSSGRARLESEEDSSRAFAQDNDGSFIVAGYRGSSALPDNKDARNQNMFVARFDADGKPAVSFGTRGVVSMDFGGNDAINEVAIQSDRKVVFSGSSSSVSRPPIDVYLLGRLQSDGTLDRTFGENGLSRVSFGDAPAIAHAMSTDRAGRLLFVALVGRPIPNSNPPRNLRTWAIVRYLR